MEDTDLILLVQAHNGLYDKKCFSFKSKLKKQQAWEDISKELGVDANTCMRRWITLRERFSKELRLNAEQGNDSNKIQRWPLFNYMTFLIPHMVARNKTYDASLSEDNCTMSSPSNIKNDPIDTVPPTISKLQKPWHISEVTSCSEQMSYQSNPMRKRKFSADNENDAVEKAANAISDLCKKRLKENKNNELEKFGTMMITMMECLPKSKQIRLMVSFMEQVANARLEVEGESLNTQLVGDDDDFQTI